MSLQKRLSVHNLRKKNNSNDMTSDLSSLNFETMLSHEELNYIPLRTRHHCLTTTSCAFAIYLVSVFNDIRQILSEMRNPIDKKTIKFLKQTAPRNSIRFGIIGCGRLGKQILTAILSFCDVKPNEVVISTRRPMLLSSFQQAGIRCISDNPIVVSSCNIVFLCCLPSQINSVAKDISGHISNECLLCSFVTGVTLPRLKQLFCHNGIAKLEYTWSITNSNLKWCLGEDIVNSLKNEHIAEAVYPLSETHRKSNIVWCNPKSIEISIYGALNMCSKLGVTTDEAIYLINMAFLGLSEPEKGLLWKDILDNESLAFVEKGNLPIFDLFHIGTQDTPLTSFLKIDVKRALLVKKYMNIFNQFKNR